MPLKKTLRYEKMFSEMFKSSADSPISIKKNIIQKYTLK
jgi:hypothetical protein